MKNWKTTLMGILFGALAIAHQSGVTVGHLGTGDFLGLVQAAVATALGYFAKDATTEQK